MKHCKILVIEYSNLDFQVIQKLLRVKIPAAFIVRAPDFATSRSHLKKRFDIVLLDLNLPDVSGQPLLSAVGAILPLRNVIIRCMILSKFLGWRQADAILTWPLCPFLLLRQILLSGLRRLPNTLLCW